MTVDVVDPQTVRFNLPAPKPGLLAHFATSFAQGFQPKHFLGRFHPDISADADSHARSLGFENGLAAIKAYFGNSDWTDTPSPLLNSPDIVGNLPKAVVPTLESFLTVTDTTEGRHYVAIPTSSWSIPPATSCRISTSRMKSTPTTTKCASSSSSTRS